MMSLLENMRLIIRNKLSLGSFLIYCYFNYCYFCVSSIGNYVIIIIDLGDYLLSCACMGAYMHIVVYLGEYILHVTYVKALFDIIDIICALHSMIIIVILV